MTTNTRNRLLSAMRLALATHGYHGIGLTELLKTSDTPKGVLYHHFPGGKRDLTIATITLEATRVQIFFQSELASSKPTLWKLRAWFDSAYLHLEKSEFQLGCPLAGAAHNIQEADKELRDALATAFAGIRHQLSAELISAGLNPIDSEKWAELILSTFEGGLLLARTARSGAPLKTSVELLLLLLKQAIDQARPQS